MCCVPVNLMWYVSNMLVCNVILQPFCVGLLANFVIKFSFLLVEHSGILYHDQWAPDVKAA